jgi:hypothetical protein
VRAALFERSELAARPQRILRVLAIVAGAVGRLAHEPDRIPISFVWVIGPLTLGVSMLEKTVGIAIEIEYNDNTCIFDSDSIPKIHLKNMNALN